MQVLFLIYDEEFYPDFVYTGCVALFSLPGQVSGWLFRLQGVRNMVKELQRKFVRTTMLVVTILLIVFLVAINIGNYLLSRRDNLSELDRIFSRYVVQVPDLAAGGTGPGEPRAEGPQMPGRPEIDEGNPGLYFAARVNGEGVVTFSDLTHAGDLTQDEMISLLREANDAFDFEVTGMAEPELPESNDGTGIPGGEQFGGELPGGDLPGGEVPEGDLPGGVQFSEEMPGEGQQETVRKVTGRASGYVYRAWQQADGSVTYVFLNVSRERRSQLRILLVSAAAGAVTWLLVLLIVIRLSQRAIAPIAENIEKQRRFITDAGHELKTPLAVIISNVDVQELHGGKTKWLDNIRAQALRLSDLTKQMLTLAKMDESGNQSFTATTFDASRLMLDTVRVFRESASLRGIQVTTQIDPDVQITFSKEQYQQMLELLMDNAVKYGRENGEIAVSMQADRKAVTMRFRNTCEELPDIDPNRLFDRFYRADTSRSRSTGGSGIGLAVVRAIAEHAGGRANAYFRPENTIEFEIELPRT